VWAREQLPREPFTPLYAPFERLIGLESPP
jgi:hypothetical protein